MLVLSNAKINLGLFVGTKRDDGFHSIESLFLPIPWYDEITIEEADAFQFSSEGIPIDGPLDANLCVRAYQLIKERFSIPPVKIKLKKNIPIGAGLGGGSSNAAFVLKGLVEQFELKITTDELKQLADRLGSDCSFFISNLPALVSGKGEVHDTTIDFKLDTYCVVVYPNIHIETKKAYQQVVPRKELNTIQHLILQSPPHWQENLVNDFESNAVIEYAELNDLRGSLKSMGAYYVSMSGSGSSFFAFFDEKPNTDLFSKDYPHRIFKLAF